jgi:hypothetical protein
LDEQTVPTGHEKITVFTGARLPFGAAMRGLGVLRNACERRDLHALLAGIVAMVPDYAPSRELLAQATQSDLANLVAAVESFQSPIPEPAGFSVAASA